MRQDLDLSIVVVSFNTKELLRNCLKSIFDNIEKLRFEVFVVDNASQDGSSGMVEQVFPQVTLIQNKENVGFAKANNQALKRARGKYFLLLNSDTAIEKCPSELINFMDGEKQAGILGCRVVFGDRRLQLSCKRFPSLFLEWYYFTFDIVRQFLPWITNLRYRGIDYHNISNQGWVSGCCFLINRDLTERIGFLDEGFFMYYEDSEYCYRAQKLTDYKVYYYPEYEVIHYHGKSSQTIEAIKLSFESAKYYFNKVKGKRYSCVFGAMCRVSWYLNLMFFCLLNLWICNPKIKKKVTMFKELVTSEAL